MKPFRGKRRGPQSPSVGFNLPAARRPRRRIRKELGAVVCVRRRAHFRRAERYDGFVGGQKPPGKVAGRSAAGVIDPGGVGPSADRG